MDFDEFDRLADSLRTRNAASPLAPMESLTVAMDEIAEAERALGMALPWRCKTFMARYGSAIFGSSTCCR